MTDVTAYFDRVWQSVASAPGTDAFPLASAITGTETGDYRTLADAGATNGMVVRYLAVEGPNWELGAGVVASNGAILGRDPAPETNTGTPINFGSLVTVSVTVAAKDLEDTGGDQPGISSMVTYTYNPGNTANSLVHRDDAAGTILRTVFCLAAHALQPGRTGTGGALWVARDYPEGVTPGLLALPIYDPVQDPPVPNTVALPGRIYWYGLTKIWEFLPDGAGLHLSQLGLVADGTAASKGQEALFDIPRGYLVDQNRQQSDNGMLGMPAYGDGILQTDLGNIDLQTMQWAGSTRFKFFSPNGLLRDGVQVPLPATKSGRGTSPMGRFTIPANVDIYTEGNQNSNVNNATARGVGHEVYNNTSSPSTQIFRTNRWYIGTRFLGNTEKMNCEVHGGYNTILVDLAMPYITVADYTPVGLTGEALAFAQYLLMQYCITGDVNERGFQGEWNPQINQQGIVDGGYATGPAPLKGAFYRIKTSNGATVTISPPIDGREDWTNNRYVVFDGLTWWQLRETADSPDSLIVNLFGSNNEILLRTPVNGDTSATVRGTHESRLDTGRFLRASYGLLASGEPDTYLVPMPAIIDRHGKHMVYDRLWARSGDQRLFGFTGKDKGIDTTTLGVETENMHGICWMFDRANRIEGWVKFAQGGNGRYFGHTAPGDLIPCATVIVNAVRDMSEFSIKVTERESTWGVVFGDETRDLYPVNLTIGKCDVEMGKGSLEAPDPLRFNYTAVQVRKANGLVIPSASLVGKVDYMAGAQRVVHHVPMDWILDGAVHDCDANASVTWVVEGPISFAALVAMDPTNIRRIVAPTITDEDGVSVSYEDGVWRPGWSLRSQQIAIDCINSNENRFFAREGLPTYVQGFKPAWKSGDASDAVWKDANEVNVNSPDNYGVTPPGPQTVRLLDRTRDYVAKLAGLGLATPDGFVNDVDRFYLELILAGAMPADLSGGNGYFDGAWLPGGNTRIGGTVNLFGANTADLRLVEVNAGNLVHTPYSGIKGSGDNYASDNNFVSVNNGAGYLTTGYNPLSVSRGMGVSDMHGFAYSTTQHRANAGDIGSMNNRMYVRTRSLNAAAIAMAGTDGGDFVSAGPTNAGGPPMGVLGVGFLDGATPRQRIYVDGILCNEGAVDSPSLPNAIDLLRNLGDDPVNNRHSPRRLFFASVGKAFPEAMARPVMQAVTNLYTALQRYA